MHNVTIKINNIFDALYHLYFVLLTSKMVSRYEVTPSPSLKAYWKALLTHLSHKNLQNQSLHFKQ